MIKSICVDRELVLSGNGSDQFKHSADNMFTGTFYLWEMGVGIGTEPPLPSASATITSLAIQPF